jgi:hypothetical protein
MSNKISKIVETICIEGCTTVHDIINTLEQGKSTEHDHTLDATERVQLIKELKEIMSVYNKP